MDALLGTSCVVFVDWRFDVRQGGLFRRDASGAWTPVNLGARAQDLLAVLLQNPGAVYSKDVLMNAAWPGVAVEANNLTVQIAALRRVLDQDRGAESYIQTVPGRGYRFVGPVTPAEMPPAAIAPLVPSADESVDAPPAATAPAAPAKPKPLWSRPWRVRSLVGVMSVVLLLGVGWRTGWFASRPPAPLSIVVMPFDNLSGQPDEDYLADALTDDLTTDLAQLPLAFVITRQAAHKYKGQHPDARHIGAELGVRYMLTGSARHVGDILRVNAQLVSTQSGAGLWSDRFDTKLADLGAGQEQVVRRIVTALGANMVVFDAARGGQERPNSPDALDLILRARSITLQPETPTRIAQARALYEQAERLDPTVAMVDPGFIQTLLDDEDLNPHDRKATLERTGGLIANAIAEQPTSRAVRHAHIYWLKWQDGHCPQVIEEARRFVETYSNDIDVYRWLGYCLTQSGLASEAVAIMQKTIQLGTGDPMQSHNYRNLQEALLLLGRYDESMMWGERALAANPDDGDGYRAVIFRYLATAAELSGQHDVALRRMAEVNKLWPYGTVRNFLSWVAETPAMAPQLLRLREAVRRAGQRDHAEEAADFAVPADNRLHAHFAGQTPLTVPGAATIRSAELARFLLDQRPLVVDPECYLETAARGVPGTIGLKCSGEGGELSGVTQDHLRAKMQTLTHGDLAMPIVAVGWNAERFDSRNLALRLVALGYTQVYWYRGGREAWEVNGLPEADISEQDW